MKLIFLFMKIDRILTIRIATESLVFENLKAKGRIAASIGPNERHLTTTSARSR